VHSNPQKAPYSCAISSLSKEFLSMRPLQQAKNDANASPKPPCTSFVFLVEIICEFTLFPLDLSNHFSALS
jgi:hypothetical protein